MRSEKLEVFAPDKRPYWGPMICRSLCNAQTFVCHLKMFVSVLEIIFFFLSFFYHLSFSDLICYETWSQWTSRTLNPFLDDILNILPHLNTLTCSWSLFMFHLACIEDFLFIELRLKHPQKYKKQPIPEQCWLICAFKVLSAVQLWNAVVWPAFTAENCTIMGLNPGQLPAIGSVMLSSCCLLRSWSKWIWTQHSLNGNWVTEREKSAVKD